MGKPVGKAITLTNSLSDPIKINRVSHNLGEEVKVKLEAVTPGRTYKVTVQTLAGKAFRKVGRIRLGLKGAPVKEFIMKAYVIVREPKRVIKKPIPKKP
ncbi:MAG: hypothetical protein JRG97_05700 [Deltaproteobacteria bacterium]|nr:hypothetical protein [Deltaproteobacteria bacterium]MBW2052638.1 hypothetical protein [Deltaproteobacteria bacterium]MBW2140553.1 hypothetical protein [Deltaproteobacteria bacterium]MBW2323053.1 hypothetical protein [Deltaproteobacteria bacterium]